MAFELVTFSPKATSGLQPGQVRIATRGGLWVHGSDMARIKCERDDKVAVLLDVATRRIAIRKAREEEAAMAFPVIRFVPRRKNVKSAATSVRVPCIAALRMLGHEQSPSPKGGLLVQVAYKENMLIVQV